MSNIDKQALRGQELTPRYYLAHCLECGVIMPSNKLIESRNYPDGDADCYCPHCNANDCDIDDLGTGEAPSVVAWNYQQKRIEALLDELETAEKRIADKSGIIESARKFISEYAGLGDVGAAEFVKIIDRTAAAGKGEAS